MPENILLEMTNIGKTLGSRLLFRNLSLDLKEGEGALLTGANGSGKSTLLRIMAGLSRPSQGKIQKRPNTGLAFLGHASFLYPGLDALENLEFWQKANFGLADYNLIEEVLELLGLLPYAHNQTRYFSKGMSQRLNFARVFLSNARLFLLDEPFSGVDRASRQIIVDELLRRKRAGTAIFMVSHDPHTDQVLADKVYHLDKKGLELTGDYKECEIRAKRTEL